MDRLTYILTLIPFFIVGTLFVLALLWDFDKRDRD